MANCKLCGKPVRSAHVIHSACWEREAYELAEIFCDQYCKWPEQCSGEEQLQEQHCDACALIHVLNLGL